MIVNYCSKPLTIITKRSILHVAAALDPPLCRLREYQKAIHLFCHQTNNEKSRQALREIFFNPK